MVKDKDVELVESIKEVRRRENVQNPPHSGVNSNK